ncbi:MAG: ABC-2 family transporter protein [Bdellovibrionales bacterium]
MKSLAFIPAYLRNNIASAAEYKFSFWSQIFGMIVNDTLWVLFWVLYFKKFPVLNGWTLNDLLVMWAVITTSFGLCFGLFHNVARLPELITRGQVDSYLLLPKNVLLHLSVSHIRPVNLGDALLGPALLLFFVPMTASQWLVFFACSILGLLVYYAFTVTIGSLVRLTHRQPKK